MKNTNITTDPILIEIKRKLYQTVGDNLKKIILFGSRARDDASNDSDYDILLLVKNRPQLLEDQLNDIAYEMLDRFGKLVMIFAFEMSAYESSKIDPLFLNIRQEGIVL